MTKTELAAMLLTEARGALITHRLFGPAAKTFRVQVMRELGLALPASKCGFNAVRNALIEHFQAQGGCIAEEDEALQSAIETQCIVNMR